MTNPLLEGLPLPDPSWFHEPRGIHGVAHTLRVMVRLGGRCEVDPTQLRFDYSRTQLAFAEELLATVR